MNVRSEEPFVDLTTEEVKPASKGQAGGKQDVVDLISDENKPASQ
jgi:hypothetical protein